MEETSKTYVFNSDGAYGNRGGFDAGAVLGMLAGNGGGLGLGGNTIGELIALAIVASIFGWNGGGFGFGGGNAGGAGFLSNQLSDNSTRDLVLQAINGADADVRALANTLNVDVESVKSGINTVNAGLAALTTQTGMSSLQIINAIQAGNAGLASQLSQCCCENRLLTTQQGYEAQIRTLEQTNQLGSQADRNANGIVAAIGAQTVAMNEQFCALKERELITEIENLKTQLNNANRAADKAEILSAVSVMINSIKPATSTT